MAYIETTATRRIARMKARIRGIQGGTSASKTVSVMLYLIALAQHDKKPTITSVVSESLPHLKRGAIRNFIDIMTTHGYFREENWNRTDLIYTFETGSQIEFFGADAPDKVRGPRRDRLFMNEANNIPFGVFEQLEVRTNEFVILDWNPTYDFWYYSEVCRCGMSGCIGHRSDTEHIILTYLDNEALPPNIRASIEQRKDRKDWWVVYGLGQLGQIEGKIYKDWKMIDEIPHEAELVRYGLDFGYTNDPTALVAVYYFNGGYILDEITFQTGLKSKQIADIIMNQPQALVVADSADPRAIDDVRDAGVNIIGVSKKSGDSRQTFLKWSIGVVQGQRISYTKRSVNLQEEYRKFLWEVDQAGKPTNVPEAGWDHAMDAVRYAILSIISVGRPTQRDIDERQERRNARVSTVLKDSGL